MIQKCFLCGGGFTFGPNLYEGHRIAKWKVMACDLCLSSNHDGIIADGRTLAAFKAHGIQPTPDKKGLIQWPPRFSN